MKNTIYLLGLFLFCANIVSGQIYNKGFLPADDPGATGVSSKHSMLVESNGTVVSVHNVKEGASSNMPNAHNVKVLKVNSAGTIIWSNFYGAPQYDDRINAICESDDGGYILVGTRGKINGANRNWIFKVDNNGLLVWEQLFYDQQFNMESLLVARTNETVETYFVVGRSVPQGIIFAMKISSFGGPIWSNFYQQADMTSLADYNLVSSMIEDNSNNGFVLAGLVMGRSSGQTDGSIIPKGEELFTLGIRLDGSVFSDFKGYNVFVPGSTNIQETAPHINRSIYGNKYVLAFGVASSFVKDMLIPGTKIAFMYLHSNLAPGSIHLYAPQDDHNAKAHSIYPDPSGFYALGCTTFDSNQNSLTPESNERASFLKIQPNGDLISFTEYNSTTDTKSRFMVQDLINQNYYIKSELVVNDIAGIGLLKTNLNGNSECQTAKLVESLPALINSESTPYGPNEFQSSSLSNSVLAWNASMFDMSCHQFSNYNMQQQQRTSIANEIEIKAFPTVLSRNISAFKLNYTRTASENVKIYIFNEMGQLNKLIKEEAVVGQNTMEISTVHLSPGLNTIVLESATQGKIQTKVIMN